MERFARKCSATGRGMNEGYCVFDGEFYFSEESHLIDWLRDREEGDKSLSDDFLLAEAYSLGEYYYTDWDIDDEDEYYDEQGNVYKKN